MVQKIERAENAAKALNSVDVAGL